MGARHRISSWIVFSVLFLVSVFGLFFMVTERKSWPQQQMRLSSADMRLSPMSSSIWCEALALSSDHPFVAYQVSQAPRVDPKMLTRQNVNLRIKLSQGMPFAKLRYFLLPNSVVEIAACSSMSGAYLLIFQGDVELSSCLVNHERQDSSEYDSDEDSFEDFYDLRYSSLVQKCPNLLKVQKVADSYQEEISYGCESPSETRPLKINITSANDYVIAIVDDRFRRVINHVALSLHLDRATYVVHKTGLSFNMCSLSTSCVIALDFTSHNRALVWIPEELNSGRTTYVITVECKPRLALFAVLSVCFPLVLFMVVAYVVKVDRKRKSDSVPGTHCPIREVGVVTPLIQELPSPFVCDTSEETVHPNTRDKEPPSYDSLYDPPPPYACIKPVEHLPEVK